MKRIVVLGGSGAVGSVAVRTLAASRRFAGIVIADADERRARGMIAEMPEAGLSFEAVDATDPAAVRRIVRGADVVLNCVGPFYRSVRTVLDAVIDCGVDYVDICDDVDVTLEILGWDERARGAGITAVIGMGASPGATNLLARFAAERLLDRTDSIDIFHTHGGEPTEGPGVIAHRFHCMTIDIPMFLDGELRTVRYFGEDGIALRQTFDFPCVGKGVPIFPYPHPEQVTLPRFLDVRRVTNKGSVLPIEYYELTSELCRLGLASHEPVEVGGRAVAPHDFAIAFLLRERERILERSGFGGQRGCLSIVVAGRKDGEPREYRIHIASSTRALGDGTGIPAAMGVLLLDSGKVSARGVLPPEGAIDPADFLDLWRSLEATLPGGGGTSIVVESVDATGRVETLAL